MYNTKMNLKETRWEGADWTNPSQYWYKGQDLINTVMNV